MNAKINKGQPEHGISGIYFLHESQNSATFSDFASSSYLPYFSFIINETCMKIYHVDVLNYFVLYFIQKEICTRA